MKNHGFKSTGFGSNGHMLQSNKIIFRSGSLWSDCWLFLERIDIIDETPSILFMENRDIALELDETCGNKKYLL